MSLQYLLDTNVVSEPFRREPNSELMRALDKHGGVSAISALTWHELRFGHSLLPDSRRKEALGRYLTEVVLPSYPVLDYDRAAADWHGQHRARLRQAGREPPFADAQIAAIAATNGLILVTRNIKDFSSFDSPEIESWHVG